MRFDLTVLAPGDPYPSWVDLEAKRFCGRVGSARTIPTLDLDGDLVSWSLPKQYEDRTTDLEFRAEIRNGRLEGTFLDEKGEQVPFVGEPAPALPLRDVTWGESVELIGTDLSGWKGRETGHPNHWSIVGTDLVNGDTGCDLVTVDRFSDFRLRAEYSYEPGANSGIYLRGRYEFQVLDDAGSDPHVGGSGAIYGLVAPKVNAALPAGERAVAEIELIGRFITVTLNGHLVIEKAEIAGPTGGALDSAEGEPGSLFLQGDHGPVVFHRLTITPAL